MTEPASSSRSGDRRWNSYSPDRRTALVFSGTGAHGAYHAGVLRGLQEAGVKVDVVAGHGIGAGSAALAAIDGSATLWEPTGLWTSPAAASFYGWKPLLGATGWVATALLAILLTPLLVFGVGLLAYPLGFVLTLLGLNAGQRLIAAYTAALQSAFASENLPTIVPRLAMLVLGILALVAFTGVAVARWRAPVVRRAEGGWWWRLIAAPIDTARVRTSFATTLWQLIRGAAAPTLPGSAVLGRRYADVLSENLGQPGFRELVLVATDLDARRDVVAALLGEPYRTDFLARQPGVERRADVLDLAGDAREHVFDVVAAGLTPPLGCDAALVTFASNSFWRGETHRLCDRPAAAHRLLEEVAAAGVKQVIVVSAVPLRAVPHALAAPRLDIRSRMGDFLAAAEAAALRDAIAMARLRFDAVFVVAPQHNALGAFDLRPTYDAASDRRLDLPELIERGYEDVYQQFIEPIVGASGEHLAQTPPGTRPPDQPGHETGEATPIL